MIKKGSNVGNNVSNHKRSPFFDAVNAGNGKNNMYRNNSNNKESVIYFFNK